MSESIINIELKNVYKSYGDKSVLSDLNLTIPSGSITAIMGISGVGKTTLLRLIAGLEAPDSGTVTPAPVKVSMLFQEDRLCEQLTATENVTLVLPCSDRASKKALYEDIQKHFSQTGLDLAAHEASPVRDLSGGMKRRVALVRAMIYPSDLVLLDEPCRGLDEATKELAVDYIKKERRGRTMIIVTHDEAEALSYGGTVVRL